MFLGRVQAAVEEEERQAAAAADMAAAEDAIATAEVSRHSILDTSCGTSDNKGKDFSDKDQFNEIENERNSGIDVNLKTDLQKSEGQVSASSYDSVVNLPYEFYHYYHGSSNDMVTLIEVISFFGISRLRSEESGMLTSGQEEGICWNLYAAGYLVTGFSQHHLQMRFGHLILLTLSNCDWSEHVALLQYPLFGFLCKLLLKTQVGYCLQQACFCVPGLCLSSSVQSTT